MKVVLVTGGFDPIHSGHLAYFKAAKELGDILVVGVNSDEWLTRKKGKPFMPFEERRTIIENIKGVGNAFAFNDDDGSAIDAIRHIKNIFPANSEIIFANGGDRTKDNIPEMVFDDVHFVFGVGGDDKKNSSSWILEEWKSPKIARPWGWYRVLDKGLNWAVKELTILPGKSLSDQRHTHRSEHWHVVSGVVTMHTEYNGTKQTVNISTKQSFDIGKSVWHRPCNNTDQPVKIVEIWFGNYLNEDDIERREFE
jgi:cytidyltransferase-like protein